MKSHSDNKGDRGMKTNHINTRIDAQLFRWRLGQLLISSQREEANKTAVVAPVVVVETARHRQSVSCAIPRHCANPCGVTFATANSGAYFEILNALAFPANVFM